MVRALLAAAVVLLSISGCARMNRSDEPTRTGVPQERLDRLTKGINLSHWFAQAPVTEERFRTFITEEDAELISRMGFRHVRLTLNPAALDPSGEAAALNVAHLEILNRGIDSFLSRGVAVIVDIHPEEEYKRSIRTEDGAEAFVRFWGLLAEQMRDRDPDRVFFEIMNEPTMEDARQWQALQNRAVEAIRAAAPDHTIIVGGHSWSGIEQLQELQPLEDDNIVYNFHFYTPTVFTHQGATWGWNLWQYMKDIPYPSSPEAVEPLLKTIENDQARDAVRRYGEERWGEKRIREALAPAQRWAEQHGVPVTCNEFGVYRTYSPREDRLRWIEHVRKTLEDDGIGWAMWDYAGGFAVVEAEDGTRRPDPGTVAALGLSGED